MAPPLAAAVLARVVVTLENVSPAERYGRRRQPIVVGQRNNFGHTQSEPDRQDEPLADDQTLVPGEAKHFVMPDVLSLAQRHLVVVLDDVGDLEHVIRDPGQGRETDPGIGGVVDAHVMVEVRRHAEPREGDDGIGPGLAGLHLRLQVLDPFHPGPG